MLQTFCWFLVDLKQPKGYFEINWPLQMGVAPMGVAIQLSQWESPMMLETLWHLVGPEQLLFDFMNTKVPNTQKVSKYLWCKKCELKSMGKKSIWKKDLFCSWKMRGICLSSEMDTESAWGQVKVWTFFFFLF